MRPPDDKWTRKVIDCGFSTGRRTVGRPILRWVDDTRSVVAGSITPRWSRQRMDGRRLKKMNTEDTVRA